MIGGSGVAVAHYLQQVTQKLALGTELAYQFGPQVPGGHIAVHSVAARYSGKLQFFLCTVSALTVLIMITQM